jgi:hypothetical protein
MGDDLYIPSRFASASSCRIGAGRGLTDGKVSLDTFEQRVGSNGQRVNDSPLRRFEAA